MTAHSRSCLLSIILKRAFSFGDFVLASGKKSTYYVDAKKVILYSEALMLLGEAIWDITKDLDIHAMGGLEVGAIPMAAAMATRYAYEDRALEGFFIRKEVKDHGSKNLIEGGLMPGMRVAVLDDVVTTGASLMRTIKAVEEFGAQVVVVISLVDRLEGAAELLGSDYDYCHIFTIGDFLE